MSTDLHSLVAPYALDALDATDRALFEAHVAECSECADELAGFVATAERLADAQAVTPPAALRSRILDQASRSVQERPVVVPLERRSALRRALPRVLSAAAVIVALVGVGGYFVERDRASDVSAERSSITAVLAATDADMSYHDLPDGGHVRIISSPSRDAAVIVADGLPRLTDGKVYQVWMVKNDQPTSQGTFATSGTMVMKGVTGADRVAVTVEPAGGSDQPTSTPIAALAV